MGINSETTILQLKKAGMISYPTFFVLKSRNLMTVQDILLYLGKNRERLTGYKFSGKKIYKEIETLINENNLKISHEKAISSDETTDIPNHNVTIRELKDDRLISYATYLALTRNNLHSINDIIQHIDGDVRNLMKFGGFRSWNIDEISIVLKKFYAEDRMQNQQIYDGHESEDEKLIYEDEELLCRKAEDLIVRDETTVKAMRCANLISVRTYNVFKNIGIKTFRDILDSIDGDVERLLNLRNFGKKSLLEVKRLIKKAEIDKDSQEELTHENLSPFMDIIAEVYADTFREDDPISEIARQEFPSAEAFCNAILGGEYDFLKIHVDLGREGNLRLRNLYYNLIERILQKMCDKSLQYNAVYQRIMQLRSGFMMDNDTFSIKDAISFLPATKKELIERSYKRLSFKLPLRALRILHTHMPTYLDVIPYFGKLPYEYNALCPGQSMKKTLSDLYRFVSEFESDVYVILSSLSQEEAIRRDAAEMFPFLGPDQIKFLGQYKDENRSYPMFYVLYHYLKTSEQRVEHVYSLLNGIRDGEFHTLLSAGRLLGLTRERVRQLSVKGVDLQGTELDKPRLWEGYAPLFALPYITELSPKYRMTQEEEELPFGFNIFARLLPLVAPFKRFQVQGKSLLVGNSLLARWNFEEVLKKMDAIFHNRYMRDTDFGLTDFVEDVAGEDRDDALGLLTYVVAEAYGCPVSEGGRFTIVQNRIDVAQEVYEILYKNGSPMHIEEIFAAFKMIYPAHKYEKSAYLRSYIQKHPHIRAIGNTSRYGLDSWDVYFGGVRDRLREILNASNVPMFVDDIVKKVLEVIPYTNRASILSSMDSPDFVSYKQDRWGLASKQYSNRFECNHAERRRKAFDERFDEFKEFVETYHRFPFTTGGEKEETICRWLNNVKNGIITTTSEQQEKFQSALRQFREAHYPESTSEYKCQEKCNEYREYLEDNYELPTHQSNEELYMWMYRIKREYNGLSENSRYYLTELFNLINSYGFYL